MTRPPTRGCRCRLAARALCARKLRENGGTRPGPALAAGLAMARLFPISIAVLAVACSSDSGSGPAASASDAGSDTSVWPDAGSPGDDAATPPPDAGPAPDSIDACDAGTCWTAPALGGVCGSRSVDEDFASGLYSAHRYLVIAPAGIDVELSLSATGGAWDPVLVVHDERGVTLHDGTLSRSRAGLELTADANTLRVRAAEHTHLGVYLTDRAVLEAGFQTMVPSDAEYTFEVSVDCAPAPPLEVRGVTLGARQEMWVRHVATRVVPVLTGAAGERIDKAAYVTWWALKEGVLDVNNPLPYSNCSFPPDQHIGPLEVCPDPDNAWQVGLSAVQAAWKTLADVEALAQTVHPGQSIADILIDASAKAGLGEQTALGQAVATSSERLRLSWLLRDAAVGFEAQHPIVYSECFVSEKSWCFGTGWDTSAKFAPSRAGADQAVADLKAIFAALAP